MSVEGLAQRWGGRAGVIAFVLASLALARAVGDRFPDPAAVYAAPHEVAAAWEEPAELRTVVITLGEVSAGERLQAGSALYATEGVFVVVDLEYEPTITDVGLSHAELVAADGRTYQPTRRDANTCIVASPAIPETCSIAFELPADAAPGATLHLATNAFNQSYDSLLVAPLPIAETADLDALLAQAPDGLATLVQQGTGPRGGR
ncbi:hypothetical protein ACQBAT_01050 [Ornithinimicrobium sp. Y1847]|uniref:hypothetical protein n=1 Tax=Ornithinimicrobium sp. Y1847 TaxID=3405419 RepID=UPI003B676ABE